MVIIMGGDPSALVLDSGQSRSRLSSATAFLAQSSSTNDLPSAAAAISAAMAALLSARGKPPLALCNLAHASSAIKGVRASGQRQVVAEVGDRFGEVHRHQRVAHGDALIERRKNTHAQLARQRRLAHQQHRARGG